MTTMGWCWPQSVRPGDAVALHLVGDRPERVDVVRDGLAPTTVWSGRGTDTAIPVGAGWLPGLYIVRLDDAAPWVDRLGSGC